MPQILHLKDSTQNLCQVFSNKIIFSQLFRSPLKRIKINVDFYLNSTQIRVQLFIFCVKKNSYSRIQ